MFDGKITSQGGHFINHEIELTNLKTATSVSAETPQAQASPVKVAEVKTVHRAPKAPAANLSKEEAMAAARKFMVGTWTCTGTKLTIGSSTMWIKWVIKEDGTMEDYAAEAAGDDWGVPKIHQWDIKTGKYTDTGERYYAFHIQGDESCSESDAIIYNGHSVQYHITSQDQPSQRVKLYILSALLGS